MRKHEFRVRWWVYIPTLLLTSGMTLEKMLNLFEPQFSQL